MMDLTQLMMMGGMGGLMGQEKPSAPGPVNAQEAFPNMTRAGDVMAAGIEQQPMFAWHAQKPTPAAPTGRKTMFGTMIDDDLAQMPMFSATGTKAQTGWDKAQGWFDKLGTEDRMMMLSTGLDGLMQALRGGR